MHRMVSTPRSVQSVRDVAAARGAQYQVLGLALIVDWQDGFFTLEGFRPDGSQAQLPSGPGPKAILATESVKLSRKDDFRLDTIEDVRKRTIAQVVARRGQSGVRAALLKAYDGKCAITYCDAVEALEAAHITPYQGPDSNHAQNGVLLRADVHSLFDLGLVAIDPENLRVRIFKQLKSTSYGKFDGHKMSVPADEDSQPSREALQYHWDWAAL